MVFDEKKIEKSFKKERDLFLFQVFILGKQKLKKYFLNENQDLINQHYEMNINKFERIGFILKIEKLSILKKIFGIKEANLLSY